MSNRLRYAKLHENSSVFVNGLYLKFHICPFFSKKKKKKKKKKGKGIYTSGHI